MPPRPQIDQSRDTTQIRARLRTDTKLQLHIAALNANKTLQDMIEEILEGYVTTNCREQHQADNAHRAS